METRDRDPAPGREDTIEGGVVLRFPGDWVGPLEELVPFGPSADRDSSPTAAPEPDFWGEDSAALQDAVAAPQEHDAPAPQAFRLRRRLLYVGAAFAALLLGVAAVLGAQSSGSPNVRGVTFSIASIPPLAPAGPRAEKRPTHRVSSRTATTRPRQHHGSTRPTTASHSSSSSAATQPTSAPSSQPTAPSSSAGSSSSQSGGAFTLGGP